MEMGSECSRRSGSLFLRRAGRKLRATSVPRAERCELIIRVARGRKKIEKG